MTLRMTKQILAAFAFLAFSLPQFAHAETGETRQSLDGPWQFSTNATAKDWNSIVVPGNWDATPDYSTYVGKGFYRRQFTVPSDWKGKVVRLRFEAVYHEAVVTLNGKKLGEHVGGYTPFEFDVSGKLNYGGTNTVLVSADNTFHRGAWWAWGGISRSVNLIVNNEARIIWQHVRSEPELTAGTAKVFIRYKLANHSAKPMQTTLASKINAADQAALAKTVTIPARDEVTLDLETTLPKEQVRLWDFDHPNLYRLTTTLSAGGKTLHEQSDRFGIRKVQVTKDSLVLNGERVRLCGFNRVSDSRETGNTEPHELVQKDVDLMKRSGANFARLMHYPQSPALLDYLDEKGILIFEEIPVWGAGDPNMKPGNPLTQQWMSEMINRDYNHPSIVGWSVGNELLQHFDYVKSMIDFTRQLDPHRLISYVSFTGARKEYNPTNDPISVSDIILLNTYNASAKTASIVHEKWPDKPIFFSEFGIKQFGDNLDATIPGLEAAFSRATEGHPYVIGVSLWTFNDYRSNYKGTPPSGNREWGVVDVQRRPKAAFEQVRKLFSPVHALKLDGRVVTLVPRNAEEVPSFTLRNYELRWKVRAVDGKLAGSGVIRLPELKPGAEPWTTTLKDAPSGALEVQLVTPTGYDVADMKGTL